MDERRAQDITEQNIAAGPILMLKTSSLKGSSVQSLKADPVFRKNVGSGTLARSDKIRSPLRNRPNFDLPGQKILNFDPGVISRSVDLSPARSFQF
jgi:hypothetical protein